MVSGINPKEKAFLAALIFLAVLGLHVAFPVLRIEIMPIAAADDDLDLEEEDLLIVADLITENITYYISSSAQMSLLSASAAKTVYTVNSLHSRMGSQPLAWEESFPDLNKQFPSAAQRLTTTFKARETQLLEEANKTVANAGETDVHLGFEKIDDYRGTTEHNFNMSAYDLSNHTLLTKYAGFADHYVKNCTASLFGQDTDKRRAMQIHYAGFANFETAWKNYAATLLGAEHGVSPSRITITDYGAKSANISTYTSSKVVQYIRDAADNAVSATSSALALHKQGITLYGMAGFFDLPEIGEVFQLSELVTHLEFPTVTDFADDIGGDVVEAWNDGTSWINSLLSEGGSYVEGGISWAQEQVTTGTDFVKEVGSTAAGAGKWIGEGFGKLTGIVGDIISSPIFLILVGLVLLAALAVGGFLLYKWMQGTPVPS